jgi:hypothetical protein
MGVWRALQRRMWIAIAVLALYTGWLIGRHRGWSLGWHGWRTPESAISVPEGLGGRVKIVQFYAREGVVTEGGATVICYGVLNAKAVRIDPPIADIWPSLNHCIEVRPAQETRYTLTAQGADGTSVAQSFTLRTAADKALLPKITSFRVLACKKDYLGEPLFKLSFTDQNAEEVWVEPAVIPTLHRAPYGEFYATPGTYTLSVKGKYGHVARQKLTVEGSKCR